jgi:hypothetical protein
MYWQYTTALASLVLAVTNPPISSRAKNVNESFIWLLLAWESELNPHRAICALMQIKVLVNTIAEVVAWVAVATVLIEIAPLEGSGELQLQPPSSVVASLLRVMT